MVDIIDFIQQYPEIYWWDKKKESHMTDTRIAILAMGEDGNAIVYSYQHKKTFFMYKGKYYRINNSPGYSYDMWAVRDIKADSIGRDYSKNTLSSAGRSSYVQLVKEAEVALKNLKELDKAVVTTPEPAPVPATPSSAIGSAFEKILSESIVGAAIEPIKELIIPEIRQKLIDEFGLVPQKHTILVADKETEIEGVLHEQFDLVCSLIANDIPVFLTGPAGSGKNHLLHDVSKALGLEFFFSNAVTNEYKLTGFIDGMGRFHETEFYRAWTKGGLFMLDEFDASVPEVAVALNAAIANGYCDFPEGRLIRHVNFRCAAAGNTLGTGADLEYTGRFQLDAATLDRFALVPIDYDSRVEDAICSDAEILKFARVFRESCKKCGIKFVVSYRAITRMHTMSATVSPEKLLPMALTKGLDKDDLKVILNEASKKMTNENKYYAALEKLAA